MASTPSAIRAAVLSGEGRRRDPHVISPLAERMAVSRPVGEDEEHGQGGHAVRQGDEQLLGGIVDPVQVLDDDDLGTKPRPAADEPGDRLHDLPPAELGIHARHDGLARVHAEE